MLDLVDDELLPRDAIPLDELRRVAVHDDDELDALVTRLWGRIGAGSAEEKLAEIRRLLGDLPPASEGGA